MSASCEIQVQRYNVTLNLNYESCTIVLSSAMRSTNTLRDRDWLLGLVKAAIAVLLVIEQKSKTTQ